MDILIENIGWMETNIFLALIAVVCGWLTLKVKSKIGKYILGTIWVLFLPNTIYMVTDLVHFPGDIANIQPIFVPFLILEYTFLMLSAVVSFIFAMYPFELFQRKSKKKIKIFEHDLFFVSVNFLVAFGMVLGRVQRLNSWDIVTNLPLVFSDALHVLTSSNLFILFLFFGLLCNLIYFPFRVLLRTYEKKHL